MNVISKNQLLVERCVGPLETNTPASLLAAHRKIHRLCEKVTAGAKVHAAELDLRECTNIDSGAMLLLMHSGMVLAQAKVQLSVRGPSLAFETVNLHLQHLRATKTERASIPAPVDDYLLRGVWHRDEMVGEIEAWADGLRKAAHADPAEVALWQVELAEVTTNSFQHGPRLLRGHATPLILVAGKANALVGEVQIAALDFGSGIPRVIESALPQKVTSMHDGQKIAYACERGVTSRCDRLNQGAGLASLVDTVKKNRGRLQILSFNGLAHVSNGRVHSRSLASGTMPWLRGTLTIINLKLNKVTHE